MHPNDEASFIDAVLDESTIQLVNGHYWKSETAPCTRQHSELSDSECLIWSSEDLAELKAYQVLETWACDSLYGAIHFSRSEIHDSVITAGRIAFSTSVRPDFPESNVTRLEKRFNKLRRFIKKHYTNSVIQWCNAVMPRDSHAVRSRKTDARHWVGPHALEWLRDNRHRKVKQFLAAGPEAYLSDDAG